MKKYREYCNHCQDITEHCECTGCIVCVGCSCCGQCGRPECLFPCPCESGACEYSCTCVEDEEESFHKHKRYEDLEW